jgi:hypothetical protein
VADPGASPPPVPLLPRARMHALQQKGLISPCHGAPAGPPPWVPDDGRYVHSAPPATGRTLRPRRAFFSSLPRQPERSRTVILHSSPDGGATPRFPLPSKGGETRARLTPPGEVVSVCQTRAGAGRPGHSPLRSGPGARLRRGPGPPPASLSGRVGSRGHRIPFPCVHCGLVGDSPGKSRRERAGLTSVRPCGDRDRTLFRNWSPRRKAFG